MRINVSVYIFYTYIVTNIESQSTDYKRITRVEAVHKVRIFLMAGYIDKAVGWQSQATKTDH